MPIAFILGLYGCVLSYAALAYFWGDWMILGTIVSMGTPMLLYLGLEWGVTPLVAVAMGFQARWSITKALLLGAPLVALYAVATPMISAGSEGLGVGVPWLALHSSKVSRMRPVLSERIVWWGVLFLASAAVGLLTRHVSPAKRP